MQKPTSPKTTQTTTAVDVSNFWTVKSNRSHSIQNILDILDVCGNSAYRAHTMEDEYVVYIDSAARDRLVKLPWVKSVEPYGLFIRAVPL